MDTTRLSMGVEIDKSLIEKNVSDAVCAAIANALGDKDKLVKSAVAAVISSYVDSEGRPCKQSYYAKPYLQYLSEKTVQEAVRKEMEKIVEENRDLFEQAIRNELRKPQKIEGIANAFIAALLSMGSREWKMPISVSFEAAGEDE